MGKSTLVASNRPSATRAVFPLVGPRTSQVAGLVTILRRLSVARSVAEIMDVVVHAARTLLTADGVTFVLREGDLCHYADEDAVAPLWKGRRFPLAACISGWCMEQGRAVAIPDIYKDPRIPHDAYRPTRGYRVRNAPLADRAAARAGRRPRELRADGSALRDRVRSPLIRAAPAWTMQGRPRLKTSMSGFPPSRTLSRSGIGQATAA